jgi:hypothetical protein
VHNLSEENIPDIANDDTNLPETVQFQIEEQIEIALTTDPYEFPVPLL